MGYRSFVVHVDDTDECERRLDVAARLARAFHGELEGVYLTPAREMTPFTSAMLPDAVVAQRMQDSGNAQARAEQRFRAAAERERLTAIGFSAPAGRPLDAALLHTYYADIAIVGQTRQEDPQAAFNDDLVYAMLMGGGRPLLAVPQFGNLPTIGENVVIAWKETRESARAVCDALPFLKEARKVSVMSISSPGDGEVLESRSDERIAAFLARHDIEARVRHETAEDIDAGNLLLSRVSDLSADLIVMGAYSRTRLAERVLGGVTRLMLQSMTVPVLMSH
jgi:nucleotide-binding universal stress UspA family protein